MWAVRYINTELISLNNFSGHDVEEQYHFVYSTQDYTESSDIWKETNI
jgi:hypothetical protein